MSDEKELRTVNYNQPVAVPVQDNSIDSFIAMALKQKDFPLDRMERLFVLKKETEDRDARKAYFNALMDFQHDLPVIKGLKEGAATKLGVVKFTYAPLEDIVLQVKDLMRKYGFSHMFKCEQNEGRIKVTCVVTHALGHSESDSMSGPATMPQLDGIQGIAGARSFLERYTFKGVLGITTSDKDIDGRMADFIAQNALTNQSVITADQVTELLQLIAVTKSDELQFCKRCNVESLAVMPPHKFSKARDILEDRQKEQQA